MLDITMLQKGQTDWHIPINNNFTAIDAFTDELDAEIAYILTTMLATGTGGAS